MLNPLSPEEYGDLEGAIMGAIDSARDDLIRISRTIHDDPETGYNEHRAAALLTKSLEERGYRVQRGVTDIETAFVATTGNDPQPTIAILAEYDALAGLGHGCGHNLIATAALGAAWGLQAVVGSLPGQIKIFGTPAEEGGGGKVLMLNRGAFDGVDAAMMFHPATRTLTARNSLASTRVNIAFRGKAAHGAATPDKGINALDGIIQTYNGINALRQHLRDDARVMGIITNGGQAANIVPDYASAQFSIRANDRAYADEVLAKFRHCAEGAALATGATLEFEANPASRYDNMVGNPTMSDIFGRKLAKIGVQIDEDGESRMGSTDMGNISQAMPAIHPYLSIAPTTISTHSIEFREAAGTDEGQAAMLNAAKALALTTLELLLNPHLLAQAKAEFDGMVADGRVMGRA